tara:strand:+ start:1016 stop:1498 length:483 start_codon:yes stop_codon:yes gene_type:complete
VELISHRGNLFGPDLSKENKPEFIDEAIMLGFCVEIDIWILKDGYYLGHDRPEIKVSTDYLNKRSDNLFIHLKNNTFKVQDNFKKLNYFLHENEPFVFTSKGEKWYLPSKIIYDDGINLMPEFNWNIKDFVSKMKTETKVCSDFIYEIRDIIDVRLGLSK